MAAYGMYRVNVATPDAIGDASQSVVAAENDETAAKPAAPAAPESKRVEPAATESPSAPIPEINVETPKVESLIQSPAPAPASKRASAHSRTAPVPVTKRASAHPRGERKALAGTSPPTAHSGTTARVRPRVMQASKAVPRDRWQLMHVSLAQCGGDLIFRIVCDQRVRRRFCEGHWGRAPECASGVVNEHGQ